LNLEFLSINDPNIINYKLLSIENLNTQIIILTNLAPVISYKEKFNLAAYLTGLIEGDGSIVVPQKHIKSYRPFFEIVFHIDDLILAQTLQLIIEGNIRLRNNYCILVIKKNHLF
jgi:hypothetical protein